jgi:CRISPR-associated exonuclease Cas4
MLDAVLALLIVLLLAGLTVLWLARKRRQRLGMPGGAVVYQDTLERNDETLYSAHYHLAGRPDHIVRQGRYHIPVEVKTGRTPDYPYPNQVMQLIAYCALVEEHYGARPPHGILLFEETGTQFVVEFTRERELQLHDILADMRACFFAADVPRSHNNSRQCAACGFRDICTERLA